jgi:FMN phosphatase YigB (HAD superfamily)
MIDHLLPYKAIAWDFDGTLIDHPKSPLMHEFIISHPERHHIILTFRSHGLQRTLFRDMQRKYPDAPTARSFAGTYNISDHAWEKFNEAMQRRMFDLLDGPPTPWEEYYLEWKGMMCHSLDLPVLIDDKVEHVLRGCEKYGIAYLHPDAF